MQFCIYSSYIQYCETSFQNDLLRSGLVLDQTWFVDLGFGDFGGFRWVCRLGLEVLATKMGSFLWMNLGFSKKVHNIRVRSNMVLRFHNTHRKESLFC